MRWIVDENDPPIRGKGYTILCDGEPVSRVVAFDTDEEWVVAHCVHGGELHMHPVRPNELCMRILHGKVEVVAPAEEAA